MIQKLKTSMFLILSTVILVILIITIFRLHYSTLYQYSNDRLYQLEILSDEIIYHDEVLTMSALTYILTEDEKWITRYQKHTVLLDDALLKAVADDPEIRKLILQVNLANKELVSMEKESFDLLKQGKKELALRLLYSDEYQEFKVEYAQSIRSEIKLLHKYESKLKTKIINNANYLSALLIGFITLFIVICFYTINYLRNSDKLLRKLVVIDVLTGLHNRRTFNDTLIREINRSRREGRILLLAICDVDNFKLYNDTYGHPEGDKVLESIGKIINQNSKRTTEFSYRIGGEEFALINSVDNHEEGRQWVQSIIKKVELLAIKHVKNPPLNLITISVGITFNHKENQLSSNQLYRQADKALYKAKKAGKNCFVELSSL